MRAACCEATVLRNEVIAPDIRLLTVVWPDRDHAPHAGQFFTPVSYTHLHLGVPPVCSLIYFISYYFVKHFLSSLPDRSACRP